MIYLLLSIVASTLIFGIFKVFTRLEIDNRTAIVVNYLVAAGFGFLLCPPPPASEIVQQQWFVPALILGVVFISLFHIMARTAQQIAISVASVANKLSVVFPIVAAVFLYGDSMSWLKVLGIAMALASVVLVSVKERSMRVRGKHLWLPLILFIGSGFIDTYLKYIEHHYLREEAIVEFVPIVFLTAGTIGLVQLLITRPPLGSRHLFGGVVLGIVNYYSIFLILGALETLPWGSSVIFPVNNMGVVAGSAVLAYALFRERMSIANWSGIGLSLLAIFILLMA